MQRVIDPPKSQWERLVSLDGLSTGLTYGERQVYNLFNDILPIQWEMYIQPYLNGLRPDLVLLNPFAGIAVFEVKDWTLSTLETFIKSEYVMTNPLKKIGLYKDQILEIYCPRLKGYFGDNATAIVTSGLIFSKVSESELQDIFKRKNNGKLVYSFKDDGQNLEPLDNQSLKLAKYYPLVGKETLDKKDLDNIFPEWKRKSIYMKEDTAEDLRGWLKDPAFSQESRQPLDIDLRDPDVREIIKNNDRVKYRRVKGPAGSGKSLTLAMRAAELASQNKKVLVCSFNITLMNYLRPLAYRHARYLASQHIIESPEVIRHKIVFLHFHSWCKRVCIESGREIDYMHLWRTYDQIQEKITEQHQSLIGRPEESLEIYNNKDNLLFEKQLVDEENILNNLLPELVQQIYNEYIGKSLRPHEPVDIQLLPSQPYLYDDILNEQDQDIQMVAEETTNDRLPGIVPPQYDAILVDEGQDYIPIWWQTLRKALKTNGEMLLVADKTQNIYGNAQSWTEIAMKGAGFSGKWRTLKSSYRVPNKITPILTDFASRFFIPKIRQYQGKDVDITDVIDIPGKDQYSFEDQLYDVELKWIQVPNPSIEMDICFEEVRQQMIRRPSDTAVSDIVFLAQTIKAGEAFVKKCEQKQIWVNHTFGQDDQRRKLAFSLDYSTIKATTLHSYKGWEGRIIVIHISKIESDEQCALFYTALTRLKKHHNGCRLTVISSCVELQEFGFKNFQPYFEVKESMN